MKRALAKAALSAAYWFTCFSIAAGLTAGDRIDHGRIVAPIVPMPPALLAVIFVLLYAALSFAWDRQQNRSRR